MVKKIHLDNHFEKWLTESEFHKIEEGIQNLLFSTNREIHKEFAKYVYEKNIMFCEWTIFLDYATRGNQLDSRFLENRNLFAKEYMRLYLKDDLKFLQEEIDLYKSVMSSKENDIFNIHISWFIKVIEAVIYDRDFPNLDPKKCYITKNMEEVKLDIDSTQKERFNEIHNRLHDLTNEAVKMLKKGEYFYFTDIYMDIKNLSFLFRELVGNIFLYQKLISIYIDPVTNINNRLKFLEDMEEYNGKTLIILNIENFSKINLTYGAKFGDKTLRDVVQYILKFDILNIYRIYADEFAVVVDDATKAKELFEYTNEKIVLQEIDYVITFYGSFRKIDKHSFEIAEYALLNSKKQGFVNANEIDFDNISVYKDNLSTIQKLKVALLSNKVKIYKQPIMELKSGKILKYECLMRIEDENRNILPPYKFMDILQSMSIYPEYTKTMIYKSFEYFKDKPYNFSINFAFSDIENTQTIDFLKKMVMKYPETAKKCTIELLENETIKNIDLVNYFFNEIESFGMKAALDDFGSGYANFSYIFSLNLDYIKLDGSIVQKVIQDEKMRVLIETVVKMAHSLDMKVIAEFVSSKQIFDFIKKLGVDYAQGYYVGRPEEEVKK